MKKITIKTSKRSECVDITSQIKELIPKDLSSGLCIIYIPHTTAGVTINEGADPDVQDDILKQLDQLIPWKQSFFRHMEGNSAAHIKASLIGSSVTVIIENSMLLLGTWQKIFFMEFDGPRKRTIWIQLLGQFSSSNY